jgi:hypothetical protein
MGVGDVELLLVDVGVSNFFSLMLVVSNFFSLMWSMGVSNFFSY